MQGILFKEGSTSGTRGKSQQDFGSAGASGEKRGAELSRRKKKVTGSEQNWKPLHLSQARHTEPYLALYKTVITLSIKFYPILTGTSVKMPKFPYTLKKGPFTVSLAYFWLHSGATPGSKGFHGS